MIFVCYNMIKKRSYRGHINTLSHLLGVIKGFPVLRLMMGVSLVTVGVAFSFLFKPHGIK